MSKHDKIAKLKEYIKNYVIKELEKDEELEEVSTTATAGIDGTGTGHYDTPHAFASGSAVGHKSPEVGGYKKVNERLSVDPRKVYGGTGAKQGMVLTAQKGLKKILDLSKKNPSNVFLVSDDNYTNFGPYYVKNGKVAKYTVANPNYDLEKNKVRSLKVPSDVILKFTINEVSKQEVNALRNLVKGIGNLKKDFSKATYIGDKELRKKDYNKHYETLLDAEKAMVKLMQIFKNKEMLGEGRYHDWRNDESLTPKQKVGKSVREIRDALNELDKTVKMNLKLKTELNMSSQDYWKNTHKALTKISERLVKMANKVGNLK
jgi:hypothetical protein